MRDSYLVFGQPLIEQAEIDADTAVERSPLQLPLGLQRLENLRLRHSTLGHKKLSDAPWIPARLLF